MQRVIEETNGRSNRLRLGEVAHLHHPNHICLLRTIKSQDDASRSQTLKHPLRQRWRNLLQNLRFRMLADLQHLKAIRLRKQYFRHFQLHRTRNLPQLPRQKNKNLSRHMVPRYHSILDDLLALPLPQKRWQIQHRSLAGHKLLLRQRLSNKLRCHRRLTHQNHIDRQTNACKWSYAAHKLDPTEVVPHEELQSPRARVHEHQPSDHKFHPHNRTLLEGECSYQQELWRQCPPVLAKQYQIYALIEGGSDLLLLYYMRWLP